MADENARQHDASAREAAVAAIEQIASLTSKKPLGTASLEPTKYGWRVGVEVLEDSRVPSSGDILALYEAEIGLDGELLSYRRTRRYRRGDVT
jgi:hypothetical protein